MKKICFVTTIPGTARSFLLDYARYLINNHDYDVTFISSYEDFFPPLLTDGMHYIPVKMKRGVGFDGISVILKLTKIFKEEKFDIVQYATPNAALYASIAAKRAGIKCRLYTQWGIRYMGYSGGIKRKIFKIVEQITCRNSTVIESESFSLYKFSISEGLYPADKCTVIWNGSACGVKLEKLDITQRESLRVQARQEYNIPMDAIVFGYCGRITRDKGLNELISSFKQVNELNKNVRLMLVGRYDNIKSINRDLFEWAQKCPEVIFTGRVNDVQRTYCAMDIFCSLSYREGFGLVVIEAAAMGLPGIVTDVPGQIDTIDPDITGKLVHAKDVESVVNAMNYFIANPNQMDVMGKNARKAVVEKYEQNQLFEYLAQHRNQLIV